MIVDVDYGDSFSRTFDSFVTIYNSSFTNVAENDNSLVSQEIQAVLDHLTPI